MNSQWFTYTKQHLFQISAQPHRFFTTLKSRKALPATQKLWLPVGLLFS